jgi:hypothetical protein
LHPFDRIEAEVVEGAVADRESGAGSEAVLALCWHGTLLSRFLESVRSLDVKIPLAVRPLSAATDPL